VSRRHSRGVRRLRVHQCEVCERWTSYGVMVGAGVGRHRYFKWVCEDCKRAGDNVAAVDRALLEWEVSRGYRTA
jgi:hypothetical protein